MERTREAYWVRHASTSPIKLHWRAVTVRHCFHVLPGESVLEIGAGSGLWTRHLTSVLRGENPVAAAVFNPDLRRARRPTSLPNTEVVLLSDLEALPTQIFDYVVGTAILCHDRYAENLRQIHRVLKPGGQMLFFEANYWNPQVLGKSLVPALGRWAGKRTLSGRHAQVPADEGRFAPGLHGHRDRPLRHRACPHAAAADPSHPGDRLRPRAPPGVREVCGTLYIWARSAAPRDDPAGPSTSPRTPELHGSTSVVVPCRNEEMNVPRLVTGLREAYDQYIAEIIIVNDAGEDATAAVTRRLGAEDPRVRLIERRPPGGVGRALKDGYAAAQGGYILSMDCDFQLIIPELRDLFDVVAAGHAGAIGSRFSHESVLINYPFPKIIANRAFHLLVRLVLHRPVRDISNNLKLYRAEILKQLDITRPDFGANAETGLQPIAAGHDILEVPISWINRTDEMGASDFRIFRFAPSYLRALVDLARVARRGDQRCDRT